MTDSSVTESITQSKSKKFSTINSSKDQQITIQSGKSLTPAKDYKRSIDTKLTMQNNIVRK